MANPDWIAAATSDARLSFISAPGIRLSADDEHDRRPGSASRGGERTDRTAPHVLIVEDELFVAWHIEDLVQSLDHHVCGLTARGEEALQAAKALAPDLVLMDINLGGELDGVETARRIREVDPIPIIFITAYSDSHTAERVREAVRGATILHKPVTGEALRKAMHAALKPPN